MLGFRTYHGPKAEPGSLCLPQAPIELSHWVIDGQVWNYVPFFFFSLALPPMF